MKRKKEDSVEYTLQQHSHYTSKLTSYQKPTEIACFSYDETRNLLLGDRRSLAYYHPPTIPSSLSTGFSSFIKRDDSINEHLDSLLESIASIEPTIAPSTPPHFVSWRGMINKIMLTPYSYRDGWRMNVTRYKNTIYIEESKRKTSDMTHREQMMTYWGYKFEELASIPKPPATLTQNDPCLRERENCIVNNHVQFCSVFKTKIGSHRIIMGGEVDCLNSHTETTDQSCYTELKTNRVIGNSRQEENFQKFKLLRVWGQSFLAGVSTIIFGFRDDDGMIKSLKTYKTLEIPRLVRSAGFVDSVLKWISECVGDTDDPDKIWTMEYEGNTSVITMRAAGTDVVSFIPDWMRERNNPRQQEENA